MANLYHPTSQIDKHGALTEARKGICELEQVTWAHDTRAALHSSRWATHSTLGRDTSVAAVEPDQRCQSQAEPGAIRPSGLGLACWGELRCFRAALRSLSYTRMLWIFHSLSISGTPDKGRITNLQDFQIFFLTWKKKERAKKKKKKRVTVCSWEQEGCKSSKMVTQTPKLCQWSLQRAVQLKTDWKVVLMGPNYYSLLSHCESVL